MPDAPIHLANLAAQWAEIADEAEPIVLQRLRSGDYLGHDAIAAFEAEFAAYVGGGVHAVACSSGTDAVELMVRATTGPSETVAVQDRTFVATLAAVERSGRRTDVGPPVGHQWANADAAIATWLYGSTANSGFIEAECRERGIRLLEDASQAHGNKRAGTIGDAAAWSLYPSKNLGACGQAGVVTFKDSIAAARAKRIREHGYDRATDRHWGRGFNLRMDAVQADILRIKLRYVDKWTARRRQIAEIYVSELRNRLERRGIADACIAELKGDYSHRGRLVVELPENEPHHAWHLFTVRCNDRDKLVARLRERGIMAGVHYRTTADGAENDWSRTTLSLPCHAQMSDSDVARVIDAVRASV
jgi:dTDP-4-amino-4,6-dideoxygalactose transaminase